MIFVHETLPEFGVNSILVEYVRLVEQNGIPPEFVSFYTEVFV